MPIVIIESSAARIYDEIRRYLFPMWVLWGAAIFWMAQHPPMGDLPQHAAQVALLRDIVDGTSPWAELVRINLGTPYLLGYGLALPLSWVFSATVALKILLSVSYIMFVWMAVQLRKYFGGDARLDWLFIPGYFGFAWGWGFVTFLLATPLVFAMVYFADQHVRKLTFKSALFLFLSGLVLVISHGLAFCFGWAISAALVLTLFRNKDLKKIVLATIPLLLLLIPLAGYTWYSQKLKFELLGATPPSEVSGEYSIHRITLALRYSLIGTDERIFAAIALFLMAIPWVMGLRIEVAKPSRWIPFVGTFLVLLLVPQYALDTWGLYARFAVFLLPTYAWMFVGSANASTGRFAIQGRVAAGGEAILIVTCGALLFLHSMRSILFDREEQDFRQVLSVVEPGQRALSLIYDKASPATHHRNAYAHSVSWYQVEKHGFVDFNFAWYPPQIVRFRAGKTPVVRMHFELHPEEFQWKRDEGDIYRYFFVRAAESPPVVLFADAPCKPVLLTRSGEWSVYERRTCQ
jgi:hypothetical protein